MKSLMIAFAGTALTGATIAAGFVGIEPAAAAGPFDRLKQIREAAEDIDEVATEVDRAIETNGRSIVEERSSSSSRTARSESNAGVAGPTPAQFASATECASVGLSNAFVARSGEYTFRQGLTTESRNGLINRNNVSPTGCTFPAMGVSDVLYVEVDQQAYARGDYSLQCVSYDGSEQLNNTNRPPENNYKGKDVMLYTGNSTGYTPTATGSNSSRSSQYNEVLASRGKEMITFNMPYTRRFAGTDFYCQHYDQNSGKSTLAFTYRG